MQGGFPLPDFGDDENDIIETYQAPKTVPQMKDVGPDIDKIIKKSGLILKCSTPLRHTSNSAVYSAQDKSSGKELAVKITPHKSRVLEEFQKRSIIPDSPFLVKTYSIQEAKSRMIMQMELCEQGDIRELAFTEERLWQMLHNISSALHVIHDSGWLHLDVSPGNILRQGNMFKLADFGTLTPRGNFTEGCEGAGPYVSPEAIAYPSTEYKVESATDIFSFGVVLLECASGKNAPRGGSQAYSKLRTQEIALGDHNYPCSVDREFITLVNRMLSVNPAMRPSALELLSHPRAKESWDAIGRV